MSSSSESTDEDRAVLELLRTPGLSVKYLDEGSKERIRSFIRRNHIERGISLVDVAKLIGNKTSGYTSWLTRQLGMQPRPFEEARLRAIKEKRRKYERRPFDGTPEDRAYLLGLRHGDLSVTEPWPNATTAIRVSTSTTHPAMAELFTNLFRPYGHVYKFPRYKDDTESYEWNLHAILDLTFNFLKEEREATWSRVALAESVTLSYLAGLLDAEGSVILTGNNDGTGGARIEVCFYNTDLDLLRFIIKLLQSLGYAPVGPFLDKPKGRRSSKYGIPHNKDYWHIQLSRFAECQSLLRRIPLRHQEKVLKAQIALSLPDPGSWADVREKVKALRGAILEARDEFTTAAETTFKLTHPDFELARDSLCPVRYIYNYSKVG